MVSMAKIVREDRNLTQDDERVWEDMIQVMELERDIANVSDICIWEYHMEDNMQVIKSSNLQFKMILQVLGELLQSQSDSELTHLVNISEWIIKGILPWCSEL